MTTIINIPGNENIKDSRDNINTNFENLNNDKLEAGDIAGKQDILAEGPFVDGDKTKLDSIEENAEVNNISDTNATDLTDGLDSTLHFHSSDRDRVNHTGTQSADTIVDGVTNGVVTLEEVSAISHNSINGKNGFNPSLSGGNTTIDFSNGDLQFVNRTTGEIVTKSYTGVAGITPIFPAGPTTYIVVDQANIGQPTLDLAVSYQATYTLEDLRNGKILLTKIGTPGGGILDLLPESWNYFDQDVSNAEFINAITPVINEDSSNIIEAGTGMTINKTSGTLLVRGGNPSITNPNRISTGLLTGPTMVSFYRDGLGGSTVTGGITTFNPDVYDDGTGVLATVGNNKWTTKRVYLTSSNLVLFEHGQAEYSTKDDAITGLFFDTYNRLVSEDSILLGAIAMKKGDTSILNDNIRLATKLGELGVGGVASSVTTTWGSITGTLSNQTDLQTALDNKVDGVIYLSTNGTDSYEITIPGITAYTDGLEVKVKADVSNTGTCTLDINGLGAKSVKKQQGTVDLVDGDWGANGIATLVYNSDLDLFQFEGKEAVSNSASAMDLLFISESSSNVANIDFNDLWQYSDYSSFKIIGYYDLAARGTIRLQQYNAVTAGGSGKVYGKTNGSILASPGVQTNYYNGNQTYSEFTNVSTTSNSAGSGDSFIMDLIHYNKTTANGGINKKQLIIVNGVCYNGDYDPIKYSAILNAGESYSRSLRFTLDSGNIANHRFELYGIK